MSVGRCSSFVAANTHIARDNLEDLKLRSRTVARVAQTIRRRTGVIIQPEQDAPRNWTLVLPILSYRLQCLHARGVRLFSIQPVLKIDPSEGNFLPHT